MLNLFQASYKRYIRRYTFSSYATCLLNLFRKTSNESYIANCCFADFSKIPCLNFFVMLEKVKLAVTLCHATKIILRARLPTPDVDSMHVRIFKAPVAIPGILCCLTMILYAVGVMFKAKVAFPWHILLQYSFLQHIQLLNAYIDCITNAEVDRIMFSLQGIVLAFSSILQWLLQKTC